MFSFVGFNNSCSILIFIYIYILLLFFLGHRKSMGQVFYMAKILKDLKLERAIKYVVWFHEFGVNISSLWMGVALYY